MMRIPATADSLCKSAIPEPVNDHENTFLIFSQRFIFGTMKIPYNILFCCPKRIFHQTVHTTINNAAGRCNRVIKLSKSKIDFGKQMNYRPFCNLSPVYTICYPLFSKFKIFFHPLKNYFSFSRIKIQFWIIIFLHYSRNITKLIR